MTIFISQFSDSHCILEEWMRIQRYYNRETLNLSTLKPSYKAVKWDNRYLYFLNRTLDYYNILAWEPSTVQVLKDTHGVYPHLNNFNLFNTTQVTKVRNFPRFTNSGDFLWGIWRGNIVVKLFTTFVSEYFKIFLRNSWENLGNSSREITRNWFWRPFCYKFSLVFLKNW